MGGVVSSKSFSRNVSRRPSLIPKLEYEAGLSCKSRIHKKSITDDYEFSDKIVGTGFSGPVRLATLKSTGKQCAVKRYDKHAADSERSEAEVYLLLDHPNICKLFAIYEDDRYLWIVMEFCAGSELYQRLQAKKVYSESDAAQVTRQMVEAVNYLHSHHIVHRDLKLENWLYESDMNDSGRLKLIDFGFSKFWHSTRSKNMVASCGSLTYVSPDTLSGSYTNACDMWSLGVTVYFLLVGVPPFFGTERQLLERIGKGLFSMDGVRWAAVSSKGKDFVRRLLVVNPHERMTSKEALNHPWIARNDNDNAKPLQPSVLHSLRQFAVSSHLKRAALTMMAYSLSTKDIDELTKMFQDFDRKKDGCISMTDFMEVMKDNFDISNTEIENLFNAMTTIKWADAPESEVCYSDFVAALLQTRLRFHEDTIREVFLKFDVDGSGYITAEDLRSVLGDTFEGILVDEVVKAADTKGDGRIDYDNFLEVVMSEVDSASWDEFGSAKRETQQLAEGGPDENRRKIFNHLLGLVDSSLALRESSKNLSNLMKHSRSTPVFHPKFGGQSDIAAPSSPHARPWDSRFEVQFDFPVPAVDELKVCRRRCDFTKDEDLEQIWNAMPCNEEDLGDCLSAESFDIDECSSSSEKQEQDNPEPTLKKTPALKKNGMPAEPASKGLSGSKSSTRCDESQCQTTQVSAGRKSSADSVTTGTAVLSRRHSAPSGEMSHRRKRRHETLGEFSIFASESNLRPEARVKLIDGQDEEKCLPSSKSHSSKKLKPKKGTVVVIDAVPSKGELYLMPAGLRNLPEASQMRSSKENEVAIQDSKLYFNFDLII